MSWSSKYEKCQNCGTKTKKHVALGLCTSCYRSYTENKHKEPLKQRKRTRGLASSLLTREYLLEEYLTKERSTLDIAKQFHCSRQYVFKKMKEYGIPLRNKRTARHLALDANKIVFNRDDGTSVTLDRISFNESFFEEWNEPMAYVLGVIYTDGNLDPGCLIDPTRPTTVKIGRLSVAQKEPELLEKVLSIMECNAKLYYANERIYENTTAGCIYYFSINSDRIYHQLTKLGLTPNKSNSMEFPEMPELCKRHFIRGCWDGDGSVFYSGRKVNASFVCGSRKFIEEMEKVLQGNGLSKRKIEIDKRSKNASYKIRYIDSDDCKQLFRYMYIGVSAEHYLERKYQLFKSQFHETNTMFY